MFSVFTWVHSRITSTPRPSQEPIALNNLQNARPDAIKPLPTLNDTLDMINGPKPALREAIKELHHHIQQMNTAYQHAQSQHSPSPLHSSTASATTGPPSISTNSDSHMQSSILHFGQRPDWNESEGYDVAAGLRVKAWTFHAEAVAIKHVIEIKSGGSLDPIDARRTSDGTTYPWASWVEAPLRARLEFCLEQGDKLHKKANEDDLIKENRSWFPTVKSNKSSIFVLFVQALIISSILILLPCRQFNSNRGKVVVAGNITVANMSLVAANVLIAPAEFIIRNWRHLHKASTWSAANNMVTISSLGLGIALGLLVETDRTGFDQTLA